MFMSINGLTEKEETFISITDGDIQTKTDDFYTILQLEYYVQTDLVMYHRSAYTLFGVLCDVGGLGGILYPMAASFMGFLTF